MTSSRASIRHFKLGLHYRFRMQASAVHAVSFNNQFDLSCHLPSAHRDWAVWRSNHSRTAWFLPKQPKPDTATWTTQEWINLASCCCSLSCQLHISSAANSRVEHQLRMCSDSYGQGNSWCHNTQNSARRHASSISSDELLGECVDYRRRFGTFGWSRHWCNEKCRQVTCAWTAGTT